MTGRLSARHLSVLVLTCAAQLVVLLSPADAQPPPGQPSGSNTRAWVDSGDRSFNVGSTVRSAGVTDGAEKPSSVSAATTRTETWWVPACGGNGPGTGLDVLCQAAYSCPAPDQVRYWAYTRLVDVGSGRVVRDWSAAGEVCLQARPQSTVGPPDVAALVLAEWRRLPMPAPSLRVQPPNGRTLVNLDTIFYTDTPAPGPYQLTLFGVPVTLTVSVSYEWWHGDGTGQSSTGPGRPYPARDVTHRYARPGAVTVGLTAVYQGRYAVAGGPSVPIAEPLRVSATPVPLQVTEARAELVAG